MRSRNAPSYAPYATAFSNDGSESRQLPQSGASPSAWDGTGIPSPQTQQSVTSMRPTWRTQSSHTGIRETLIRGEPQRRHSEGNSTAKTLAAALLRAEAIEAI